MQFGKNTISGNVLPTTGLSAQQTKCAGVITEHLTVVAGEIAANLNAEQAQAVLSSLHSFQNQVNGAIVTSFGGKPGAY